MPNSFSYSLSHRELVFALSRYQQRKHQFLVQLFILFLQAFSWWLCPSQLEHGTVGTAKEFPDLQNTLQTGCSILHGTDGQGSMSAAQLFLQRSIYPCKMRIRQDHPSRGADKVSEPACLAACHAFGSYCFNRFDVAALFAVGRNQGCGWTLTRVRHAGGVWSCAAGQARS